MALSWRHGYAGVSEGAGAIIGHQDAGQIIEGPSEGGEGIIVGVGAIIYKGTKIGNRCRIGNYAIIRSGVTLGDDCVVEDFAILGQPTGRPIKNRELVVGAKSVIRAHSIIYQGTTIGAGLQTGHGTVIREENNIGSNLQIWSGSTIDYGCALGDDILVHNQVYIPQFTIIENGVFLAPGVKIANDKYPMKKMDLKGPTIKRGARVGMGTVLNPEITIGENAYVASGSMVTKDVPAREVWMGNPARRFGDLRTLNEGLKKRGFTLKDVIYKPEMDREVMEIIAGNK
ncbi:MAG: DapH/DapD/GlmU-related protein [Nanoarchaeota archaeon]